MSIFSRELIEEACAACKVKDFAAATIGDVVLLAGYLEKRCGVPFIRMDQGSPGLPPNRVGIEAEKRALDAGVGSLYPPADGIPELKEAASRFVRSFLDIDISPKGCIPSTGSVAATFGAFAACTQRIPGKDKVLFIDPGFPIQKAQLRILGVEWESFDIYSHRGADALRSVLEPVLSRSDIAAIVYSNPDNPAWICLEEEELRVIGELASRYDVVVMEDLAYLGMDYRKDFGHPGQAPFIPTVARYTDNWILLLSASKIFSYAGQRIALCCVNDRLFDTVYPALAERYGDAGVFGQTLVASIMYPVTSGCTASVQYGYAAMLRASCEGAVNFVEDTREYADRAARMKEIFLRHGFHIVYDKDVTSPIGDGFFFSIGYGNMTSEELMLALFRYGISSISLSTTGSLQQGVRACVSTMREELYALLDSRLALFESEYGR